MLLEAIYHKPYSEYAFAMPDNRLTIRLRTRKDDIKNVILVFHEKYDTESGGSMLMSKIASDEAFDYYEARTDTGIRQLKYMFYIEGTYGITWYNANGFHHSRPDWGLFTYADILNEDQLEIPEWWKNSVVYQIFPDRFTCNTGLSEEKMSEKSLKAYLGGNIEGLIRNIPYFIELGINVIYLNPIFKANSYHRYDTSDYYRVDPAFGNEEQLKLFIDICHKKGIRVILDGVFNHCGKDFFAFRDLMKNGGDSKYKEWFFVEAFPVSRYGKPNYQCFGNFGDMPKLNTSNSEVISYFCKVAVYWIEEFDIDGWRLDVADELSRVFIRELRKTVRMLKRSVVIIGEIWDEASSWLGGDQLHSSTNYPVKSYIDDLFAYRSINAEQFKQRISKNLMSNKHDAQNSMLNIIGTHDTPRFLTLCGNDRKRFILAAVFQFTFPGTPLIYYGDEIGMTGEGDPWCRMPMIWDKSRWDMEMLELYKILVGLKRKHPALSSGEFSFINAKNSNLLMYVRRTENAAVIVVINATDKKQKGMVEIEDRLEGIGKLFDLREKLPFELKKRKFKVELKPFQWQVLHTVYL